MEFQKEELNEILNIFQQESIEIISSMDGKLLMLEKDGKNTEIAMQLFRDAHSLKGSARMLGFEDIQNLAHKIEDIISLVKEEKLAMTSNIADTISECLEFISSLINKTVSQKEEYKSSEIQTYIEKLETIINNYQNIESQNLTQEETNPIKKEFLEKFEKIENILIEILFTISSVRKSKDFEKIYEIEGDIRTFESIIKTIDSNIASSFENFAQNILNSLDKFKMSDNKEFSFLEVNNCAIALIEAISKYADKEHIKRKDYYEIVEEKLKDKKTSNEIKEINLIEHEKANEIIERLPLLELNIDFLNDVFDLINDLISKENNPQIKTIYKNIKETLEIFKEKNTPITHDITLGIKEILNSIKQNDSIQIKEALTKSDVIKTMIKFQYKNKDEKSGKIQNTGELSQKEILNTITNTEIKTLRVDSTKLDNLVGQIGELIVSKIKTNEQL